MAPSPVVQKPIRVIGLFAENVKMLKVADLTPNRNVNRITGANCSGKSSLIESLSYGLASAKTHPPAIIRTGEERMTIRLELGNAAQLEFTVIRRATADGETDLTLEAANGTVLSKPQHILDSIRGSSGFEPIAFLGMDAKGQMETLRKIVTVDVDLDLMDSEIVKLMEERRQHRPTIGPLEDRRIKLWPQLDPDMDVSPITTDVLLDAIQRASAHNATVAQEKVRRTDEALHARNRRIEATELREQARRLIEQAESFERTAAGIEKMLEELPPVAEPVDLAALRTELASMQGEQKKRETEARLREEYSDAYVAHKAAVAKEEALTLSIEELRRSKREAIARATMPVPKLSWDDTGVTYNDLPFSQASQAERIRVAVGIWIAQNPVLRILCVREASLLDEDAIAIIEEMAEQHDFQVWLELVTKQPGPIGVHMRAGEVVALNGVPV